MLATGWAAQRRLVRRSSATSDDMEAEGLFLPSDVVHQDDERIDYGPVTVGGKTLVLPVRAVAITEVVPNGESGDGGVSTRCTPFTSEYKNYHLAQK